MIKHILICDKCKKEMEATYECAEDVTVFITRRNREDKIRIDLRKDICKECNNAFQKYIEMFFNGKGE